MTGAVKLGLDEIEDARADALVFHQRGIQRGDAHVRLGQALLRVVDHGLEERPAVIHLGQQVAAARFGMADDLVQRAPQAIPAWQHEAALHPREDPGDRAQVRHGARGLAVGWARAELQPADLGNRRGGLPEGDEIGVVVHQRLIGGVTRLGHALHRVAPVSGDVRLILRDVRRQQHAIGHLLQRAVRNVGVVIACGEHLALFGDTNVPILQPARLRQNRLGRRAAAARDGPAAPVEERKPHAGLRAGRHNRFLGLEQSPVCRDVTAVFVAVGVAQHHHLMVVVGAQMFLVLRVVEHGAQDDRRIVEVF